MASISHEKKNGHRTIQFAGADGKRRSIRLGKANKKTAEAVKTKVEELVACSITGSLPSDETSRWVVSLHDVLRNRLAAVGLIEGSGTPATLKAFLDDYVGKRSDVKGATRINYGHTVRNLVAYFGPSKNIRSITPGDADDWRLWLVTHEKLADDTVRKRCGNAKQFFKSAVRSKLLPSNPFEDLASAVRGNPDKEYFVTPQEAESVLAECPDVEWRLLFALSRYGGLRCPSEHLALRWTDVDWGAERVTIHSSKTEHHPGGKTRQIPLFPELLPHLREAFELAGEGAEFVITRYRGTNKNLRTQLNRIIKRAGLKVWPKLFQNLRSTRETELNEDFPTHVVCKWIGNSPKVAAKHYLQVTDDHFRRASEAVQNPVQQPSEHGGTEQNSSETAEAESAFFNDVQGNSRTCKELPMSSMGEAGFEPARP